MFDRRFVEYFDWGLFGLALLLGCIGLSTLYSVISAGAAAATKTLVIKQAMWFGIGLLGMAVCIIFNYKLLDRWANPFYFFCLLLLLAVLFFGKLVSGSQRWLVLGPVSIQPSELVKVAVILVLAKHFSKHAYTQGYSLRQLVQPFIWVALPFGLVVVQPDLGTALIILLIAGSMTLYVKIERRSLIYLVATCLVTIPLVWFYLKDYQKQRILTFLNPERDPLGAGYHIIQSKIAIGSGMLTGKGFLKGTQNVLSFLPEQHTDFIFSVFAEEWGFLGAATLIFLFLILILWALNVAYRCRDSFGTILSVGIAAMFFWQVVINVAMVMGLMPVVGVPLPFVSYGGSSVATLMLSIGLLINVSMRRYMLE